MTAPDDETHLANWIADCARGDRQAFRRLYDATAPRLLGVISRLVGRGAQAEDLLQDVYERVWKSAGQYRRDGGAPMAWLCAAARYRAIDLLRARGARPEFTASVSGDEDDGQNPAERLADTSPGPAAAFESASQSRTVRTCLDTLAASQQQSIALAYYRGLSHSEIAEHLGAPLGSVKTWVRRGLASLKECLERCGWTGAWS